VRRNPRGIDVVFETVGRTMFDTAVAHVAPFGRILVIGVTAEYGDGVSWESVTAVRIHQTLLAKSATIVGSTLAAYPRQVWARHLETIEATLRSGELAPMLDATQFSGLEDLPDAVDHVTSGRNRGKVLVRL
jgi:NADPH-dependent curcumin reductase CurA